MTKITFQVKRVFNDFSETFKVVIVEFDNEKDADEFAGNETDKNLNFDVSFEVHQVHQEF